MLKFLFKKLRKNNKGFTLVELIAVIAILGIIAAIAVPRFTASREKAAISAHNANVRTLKNAANLYSIENEQGANWPEENEDWKSYIQEWPNIPKGLSGTYPGENGSTVTINEDTSYVVIITNEGEVTVTPDFIDDSTKNKTNKILSKVNY